MSVRLRPSLQLPRHAALPPPACVSGRLSRHSPAHIITPHRPRLQEPLCTHLLRGVRICHGKVHLLQHLLDAYLPHFGLLQPSLRDDVLLLNSGLW